MTGDPILKTRHLTYAVGKKTLVAEVDFDLRQGELHAIIGRNGAGKSTLLKLVTGELSAASGSIELWSKPMASFAVGELAKKRAVLTQHTELNFNYTVLEVALLGRLPHQKNRIETVEDVRIALDCLARVRLEDYAERDYRTLSGGEQQRTHLARVLAQLAGSEAGRLLVLDEPTSSLDLHHQHQTLELALSLAREGAGVVVTLHDLNLAARYADRITLMSEGRVIIIGTPSEVLQETILAAAFHQPVMITRHPCFDCPLVVTR